ncbi:MAG: isoaspartyl peptidase/L-asparaginase [Pyrinomonadaceae bacterium]|nr:isoaspartyl peptidase/L-asparaginase [Pyrinomonadaceae bacterium]MCX7640879.1 isoaspartyl peptidase/L-asparaginase [Pyrinomonadaceae bacterium]MDW8304683.1 isoaspartyl peptidase/L-asparaginase [Acidobacteriota bacterium]
MKKLSTLIFFAIFAISGLSQKQRGGAEIKQLQSPQNPRIGFVVHGGAGVIPRGSLTPEKEAEYRQKLEEALMAGYKALQEGKSALDAVEIAIRILEDSPLFNAGKGAVFTADGRVELDASIMDGKTLKAGAVAGIHTVKNPISLARVVMEKSPHVMLIGEGAEKFAVKNGLDIVDPKYFWTKERWEQYERVKKEREKQANQKTSKYGTVGAVALDKYGNLAAGTSTGGMTYKMFGRVGDTPIIGAGTYANNETCAVSATGWGEYFIRLGVARDISALMEYRALPIQQAVDLVIQQKLKKLGGDGGVIAIDKFGNIGISFNTEGMYRAYINSDGKPVVLIYKDE